MSETILQGLWDIILTAIGVWAGFSIAVSHDKKNKFRAFESERKRVLEALLVSLQKSSSHIEQMYREHFPKKEYPSYPLDTEALTLIIHDTKRLLPDGAKWPERLNSLRFELDHVNRKILMSYLAGVPIDPAGLTNDWIAYNTTARTLPSQLHTLLGMSHLILSAKSDLDELIGDLSAYLGKKKPNQTPQTTPGS